jgi:hypothetical protein
MRRGWAMGRDILNPAYCLTAPKVQNKSAQGNALGDGTSCSGSPESAKQLCDGPLLRPYRASTLMRSPPPRALPWADLLRTFGAARERGERC